MLDISQERLAYASDVDRTYMGKIERGVANPTVKVLHKLSRILHTTISELTKNIYILVLFLFYRYAFGYVARMIDVVA
ncbi:MAG: helix-turn-helix transcriptional regulator [Patescibacteria group bacterium]